MLCLVGFIREMGGNGYVPATSDGGSPLAKALGSAAGSTTYAAVRIAKPVQGVQGPPALHSRPLL